MRYLEDFLEQAFVTRIQDMCLTKLPTNIFLEQIIFSRHAATSNLGGCQAPPTIHPQLHLLLHAPIDCKCTADER